jgi:hypothetical protein
MPIPYNLVSRDTQRSLEEFSDQFKQALVLADVIDWSDFGLSYTLSSVAGKVTFPLPIDAAGYREFKGDAKYRKLYERSMSFTTKQWQDGVQMQAIEIEAPDFAGWAQAPDNMAREWKRLPMLMLASLLQGPAPATNAPAAYVGPLLDLYRDRDSNTASTINWFSTAQQANVFDPAVGTFSNLRTTTVANITSGAFMDDLYTYAMSVVGPNGKPLDVTVEGSTILTPTTYTRTFKKLLEQDTLLTAVSNAGVQGASANVVAAGLRKNIDFGQVSYQECREFNITNGWDQVFFVVLGGATELYPWVALTDGAPEEALFDKSSEFYKETSAVKIGYKGNANVGAAMPHRIVRYQVTG